MNRFADGAVSASRGRTGRRRDGSELRTRSSSSSSSGCGSVPSTDESAIYEWEPWSTNGAAHTHAQALSFESRPSRSRSQSVDSMPSTNDSVIYEYSPPEESRMHVTCGRLTAQALTSGERLHSYPGEARPGQPTNVGAPGDARGPVFETRPRWHDRDEASSAHDKWAPPSLGAQPSTLIFRCLPKDCSREDVVSALKEHGFARDFDFVYLPCHFATGRCFGYAFVNFRSAAKATACMRAFHGFTGWRTPSEQSCDVDWATTHGLESNVARYRNSNLMHPSVRDALKPMVFDARGEPRPFPRPTKKIPAPKSSRLRCPPAGGSAAAGGGGRGPLAAATCVAPAEEAYGGAGKSAGGGGGGGGQLGVGARRLRFSPPEKATGAAATRGASAAWPAGRQ